jgi:hypothetical protein
MIIQCQTNSFRSEMIQAGQDLATDTLKIALYTGDATLGPMTTAYSTTNEVTGTGYTAGGKTLTGVTITTSTQTTTTPAVVYVNFNDVVWNPANFTARGALIYNASKSDKSVAVIDFGADKTATSTFTITMPANTSTSALLRFP